MKMEKLGFSPGLASPDRCPIHPLSYFSPSFFNPPLDEPDTNLIASVDNGWSFKVRKIPINLVDCRIPPGAITVFQVPVESRRCIAKAFEEVWVLYSDGLDGNQATAHDSSEVRDPLSWNDGDSKNTIGTYRLGDCPSAFTTSDKTKTATCFLPVEVGATEYELDCTIAKEFDSVLNLSECYIEYLTESAVTTYHTFGLLSDSYSSSNDRLSRREMPGEYRFCDNEPVSPEVQHNRTE
jgi:hypothetical protein